MIYVAKPDIGKEEEKAVLSVLRSGMLAMGEVVTTLENDFAKKFKVKHAIATSSGTTALQAALFANDLKPGDEVITTPFTFIATANSILSFGAKPVFVDIDERTYNIDPSQIEKKITKKTVGIMPVHLYGQACDMARIASIAKRHKLFIVEDACQAHGAAFKNKHVGSWGEASYSLYPTKNMTSGEGGIVTTNIDKKAEKMRLYINHGQRVRYKHTAFGLNFRLTNIHAAIGVEQLKKLQGFTKARQKNAKYLDKNLKDIETPYVLPNATHVYHQYAIKVKRNRDRLIEALAKEGIGTGVHYPMPIHKQDFYKSLGYGKEKYPVAEKASNEVLSLPVHPLVTAKDLEHIAKTANRLYKEINCG